MSEKYMVTCPEGGLGLKNVECSVCNANWTSANELTRQAEIDYLQGPMVSRQWGFAGRQTNLNPIIKRCKGCKIGRKAQAVLMKRANDKRYRDAHKAEIKIRKRGQKRYKSAEVNKRNEAAKIKLYLGATFKRALELHAKRLDTSAHKLAAGIIKDKLREMAKDLKGVK